ncbi:hypothetical protein KEM55_004655, partial [Ascosphaera atra]
IHGVAAGGNVLDGLGEDGAGEDGGGGGGLGHEVGVGVGDENSPRQKQYRRTSFLRSAGGANTAPTTRRIGTRSRAGVN